MEYTWIRQKNHPDSPGPLIHAKNIGRPEQKFQSHDPNAPRVKRWGHPNIGTIVRVAKDGFGWRVLVRLFQTRRPSCVQGAGRKIIKGTGKIAQHAVYHMGSCTRGMERREELRIHQIGGTQNVRGLDIAVDNAVFVKFPCALKYLCWMANIAVSRCSITFTSCVPGKHLPVARMCS
jgi:hypothetical protein